MDGWIGRSVSATRAYGECILTYKTNQRTHLYIKTLWDEASRQNLHSSRIETDSAVGGVGKTWIGTLECQNIWHRKSWRLGLNCANTNRRSTHWFFFYSLIYLATTRPITASRGVCCLRGDSLLLESIDFFPSVPSPSLLNVGKALMDGNEQRQLLDYIALHYWIMRSRLFVILCFNCNL